MYQFKFISYLASAKEVLLSCSTWSKSKNHNPCCSIIHIGFIDFMEVLMNKRKYYFRRVSWSDQIHRISRVSKSLSLEKKENRFRHQIIIPGLGADILRVFGKLGKQEIFIFSFRKCSRSLHGRINSFRRAIHFHNGDSAEFLPDDLIGF